MEQHIDKREQELSKELLEQPIEATEHGISEESLQDVTGGAGGMYRAMFKQSAVQGAGFAAGGVVIDMAVQGGMKAAQQIKGALGARHSAPPTQ